MSHPEVVQFAAMATTQTGMEHIELDVARLAGPGGYRSINENTGLLQVELHPRAGTGRADDILEAYGFMTEWLRIGSFPYPMPDPAPESVCHSAPPEAIDPADLGLTVTVDLPASIPAGDTASGTFTVTNNGTGTYTLWWGYEVTAYLGTGTDSISRFNGGRKLPLTAPVLEPGDSVTGRLDIATDTCDPTDGYRHTPGTYTIWGHVNALIGPDRRRAPFEIDHGLRLPPVSIELTAD